MSKVLGNNNRKGTDEEEFLAQDYNSFYSLVSHTDSTPETVLLPLLVSAGLQIHHLLASRFISEEEEDVSMMASIIIHTLLTMRYNTHAIIESLISNPAKPLLVDIRYSFHSSLMII